MHENDALAEIVRAAGRRQAPPQEHYDQVYAATRGAWKGKLKSRRRNRWYALAASLAIVGVAGFIAQRVLVDSPELAALLTITNGSVDRFEPDGDAWVGINGSGVRIDAGTRIRTGAAGTVALELSDGGSLRLDQNSEIVIGRSDVVLAAGRMYFDSYGRPADLAISVSTPYGTVRDIGTQFEVLLRPDAMRIRVREGEIVVTSDAAVAVTGQAGEEIDFLPSGTASRRPFAADDEEWLWVQSLATPPASGSVLTYLRWIERETGIMLRFESATVQLAAENLPFEGTVEGMTGATPAQVLESIEPTSRFTVTRDEDGAITIGRN